MVWHGTRRTDWECGWLRKVPRVQNGIVDGLERCTDEYGLGCGWYPAYRSGMWMAWKGTSYMEWECRWFGKVPMEQFGLWSVPGVRIGNVDGLKRYIVYRLGLWSIWKGSQSTVWLMIVSVIGG
jgi:hypothetical protein